MTTRLETRLRALHLTTPPGLRPRVLSVSARRESGRSRPARHRLRTAALAAATVVALLLAGNIVAVRFLPVYAGAIGCVPWLGPASQEMGIVPAQIKCLDQTVTADGHSIRLYGVEATPLETIAFLQVDNQPPDLAKGDPNAWIPMQATLADQFGRAYHLSTGGPSTYVFQPISGTAAQVGAQLTLKVTLLVQGFPQPVNGQLPGLHGPWTFSFDATITPFQALPAVGPLVGGAYTCRVSDLKASGNYVSFSLTYSGPVVEAAAAKTFANPGAGIDLSFIQPTVTSANGAVVPVLITPGNMGFGITDASPPFASASWTGVVPSAGSYTLSCSAAGSSAPTARIQVP
ncbi:MAG: hypothetical protein ACREQM_14095 [Candidatus Dormibacteraceae bacterium]